MTETIDYSEEKVTTLVKDLCADLVEHPPLDGCLSLEGSLDVWRYARLRNREEMLGLLALGEMLERSPQPLTSFTSSMLMWLDAAREEIREEAEADLPDTHATSRSVH